MAPGYWLVKSEPSKYGWDQLVDDGRTFWDGVRNYEARNNLRAMRIGDLALYYHSNEGKEVVGVARVVREAYPDPTTDDETWVVVDVEPVQRLERPVSLGDVRADPALAEIALVKKGRISVVPVLPAEFERVLVLGATTLGSGAAPEKLPPREPPARPARAARKKAVTKKRARKAAAGKKSARKQGSKKVPAGKSAKKSTRATAKGRAKRRAKNGSTRSGARGRAMKQRKPGASAKTGATRQRGRRGK